MVLQAPSAMQGWTAGAARMASPSSPSPAYASPSSFQAGARALQWPHLRGVGAVSFRRSRAEREIANGEARGATEEGRSERVVFVACQRRVTLSSS